MNALSPVAADHRESSDTYRAELFRQGNFRLIVCHDGLQWIAQRRRGAEWRAFGYFITRDALARVWRRATGAQAPEIYALPDRFRRP